MARLDKKLAGVLAKYGVVAHKDADEFVAAAEGAGQSLTEYLINEKLAAEPDIIGAVSMEMNLPPIDLDKVELDPEVLELIPEDMARRHQVLPVAKIGRTLTLAVADPLDILSRDDVRMVTGCALMPVVSTDVAIKKTIQKAYAGSAADMQDLIDGMDIDETLELAERGDAEIDVGAAVAESESEPVVKLANILIVEAVKARASDIHIEPSEKRVRVRYRIDGVCVEKLLPPKKLYNALVSRIKIMTKTMDIAEHYVPQDGKIKMKFKDRDIDFRVSILPLIHGEKVVLRILDTAGSGHDLDGLGFEEKALKDFSAAIAAANGMVLVTGPTGSGKSTTLYSAIKKIMSPEINITTVEDPVEYTMDGVNQIQVDEAAGRSFSGALRAILRQDPDILLVGEIRDQETAEIAVKAALTGHVVFSTLHTNDAASTITRLVDMGVERFLVASCVNLVSAQRLVRRICPECKKSYKATEEQMDKWGFTEQEIAAGPDLFRGAGCERCNKTGYKGRQALLETLPLNEELRETIIDGTSADAIKRKGLEQGMMSLRRVGILNAIRGMTSVEEVLDITMPDR